MAEIRTVTTLIYKRDEIERAIVSYEAALTQAHIDLAALNATIAHFQRTDVVAQVTPYFDLHRLFKRGEMFKIARDALEAEGPLSTIQLAQRIVVAKGFDADNHVLRKAICYRLVHALRLAFRAGKLCDEGKVKGVRVWKLAKP
jgi:hypothetical protein